MTGSPGSGKTTWLMRRALEAVAAHKRVWWVGLPSQRSYIYRLATEQGALLGLEFLSLQQVYYRLVARSFNPHQLLIGTGRIACVGEALLQLRQELPSPGEARLFTRAIAEAKRFLVSPEKIPGDDAETRRFRAVYQRYEALKRTRGVWDYDDFRAEALRLAEAGEAASEADLIVVDGFRELGPLDVRLFLALGQEVEVRMALPEAPPGTAPQERLPPRPSTVLTVYRAANPVSESRWVLRALKRDLAQGADSLELAVILPASRLKAFSALADEYGVPLADETPKALADTPGGRLLCDLLELPDYPTASKLLAIPELLPLANAALRRGVAGPEALTALAMEVGLKEVWRKWLALLEASEASLEWAEQLVDTTLYDLRSRAKSKRPLGELDWEQLRGQVMERAKEAASLAKGASFRAWWAALLRESSTFERPPGGVALVTAKEASGRRFGRVYLLHAVEGAYSAGEVEDYFVPEELREVEARASLPRRFAGRDEALFAELRSRGGEVVITYPEADRERPLVAEPGLVEGGEIAPLPEVPAGSRLELSATSSYAASVGPLELGSVTLAQLQHYEKCSFRFWAERRVEVKEEPPWWLELLIEMRAHPKLNTARLEVLKERYPAASSWLAEHAALLGSLTYGVSLTDGESPEAYLDAARRTSREAALYRFVAPGRITDTAAAGEYINGRWNELCGAGYLLEHHPEQVGRVYIVVWPVLGEPVDAYEGGIGYRWRRIASREAKARTAYARFRQGEVTPTPGFHCKECAAFDLCREGKR
jgi:hypothetical protein